MKKHEDTKEKPIACCLMMQGCDQCKTLFKKEVKREVYSELFPLIAALIGKEDQRFTECIERIRNTLVPASWDDEAPVQSYHEVSVGIGDIFQSRKEFKIMKKSLVDIPVIRETVKEIIHTEKRSDILNEAMNECGLEAVEVRSEKENFLKGRIEQLEDSEKDMKSEIKNLKDKNDSLEKQIDDQHQHGLKQESEIMNLKDEKEELKQEIDNLNQYGRKEILEVGNMEYSNKKGETTKDQVINFFNKNMNINIAHYDISTCHRMHTPPGSDWNGGSRLYDPDSPPVYVKFISRDVKNYVLRRKAELRGRGKKNPPGFNYLLNENLTPKRRALFKEAK